MTREITMVSLLLAEKMCKSQSIRSIRMETAGHSTSFILSLAGQTVHPVRPVRCFCVVAFFTERRRLAAFMVKARSSSLSRLRVGNGSLEPFILSEVNRTQAFLMAVCFLTLRATFLGQPIMMAPIILVLFTSFFHSRLASGTNGCSIASKGEATDKIPLVTWCSMWLVISTVRQVKAV